nr:hypothetical protein GCM10020093_042690 [Planobispora longispora]
MGQQVLEERGAGVHEVLAGVDDQQDLAVPEPLDQRLVGRPRGLVGDPEGRGDRVPDHPLILQAGQIGEPHAVAELVSYHVRDAQGGAGLPDAADAGHGDEAVLAQLLAKCRQQPGASHEAGELVGEIALSPPS